MRLFLDNGYLDMCGIITHVQTPFIIIVNARGTGKTYGALKTFTINLKKPFIYMRRTQVQVDIMTTPSFSSFIPINNDLGINAYPFKTTRYTTEWWDTTQSIDEETSKLVRTKERFLGTSLALSTMHNIRGVNADEEYLFYDEFIPEKHERPLKEEGAAFLNAYETLNRNRELEGRSPIKAVLCSNSNQLDNAIFDVFGIVDKAENMKRKGQEICIMPERGITLIIPRTSAISRKKANTALYKAAQDKKFKGMALENNFAYDTPTRVSSRPLREYKPLASYKGLVIYRHKSSGEYYASRTISGAIPDIYGESEADGLRFRQNYQNVFRAYIYQNVVFENYSCEILFKKIFIDKL